MRSLLIALMLLIAVPAAAQQTGQQCSCQKFLTVKLSETSYTLNVWKHIKNAANAVTFKLPVSCEFYDTVHVGDDLLREKFRWGSLAVGGTFGNWNLEVVEK